MREYGSFDRSSLLILSYNSIQQTLQGRLEEVEALSEMLGAAERNNNLAQPNSGVEPDFSLLRPGLRVGGGRCSCYLLRAVVNWISYDFVIAFGDA